MANFLWGKALSFLSCFSVLAFTCRSSTTLTRPPCIPACNSNEANSRLALKQPPGMRFRSPVRRLKAICDSYDLCVQASRAAGVREVHLVLCHLPPDSARLLGPQVQGQVLLQRMLIDSQSPPRPLLQLSHNLKAVLRFPSSSPPGCKFSSPLLILLPCSIRKVHISCSAPESGAANTLKTE